MGGTLGSTHATGPASGLPAMPPSKTVDPALAFRMDFTNPGGMWMPEQMTLPGHVEIFTKMGVKIPAARLADPLAAPLAAIVQIPGCTASFVSPEGLMVTNHHCVQGSLQFNSTPEENLVETGFLAKTKAEERSTGPDVRVEVVQKYTDVTMTVRDGLDKIADANARKLEVDKRKKELVAGCEKDRPAIRCSVASFFRGGQFTLIEAIEIRDIRLVYVPHRAVGDYGGEIDNWAWPRHTGDFSFYRAYVGKDGQPADYSPDNVPFKPAHHLQVSAAGLSPGDFVMVTGYPGSTSRTETALDTHHRVEWYLPYTIANLKEKYAIYEKYATGEGGPETAIKAGVAKGSIQNRLEKSEGVLKGMTGGDLLARKDALDKQVKDWAAQPGHETHKAAIEQYEAILVEDNRGAREDYDRGQAFSGSKLFTAATSLVRWTEERQKPDAERKPGYQDRDLRPAMSSAKRLEKGYDATLDRAIFRLALVRAMQLPESERPWLALMLDSKKKPITEALIDKTLDGWYAQSKLLDEKVRLAFLEKGTSKQLAASKDPFIKAALRIWPTVKAHEKTDEARIGATLLVSPLYVDAMRQVLGGQLASDANSTLRITYGTVRSYKPTSKEETDWPFTIAAQIPAKNTGTEPFDAPAKVLAAIQAKNYGPYADQNLNGELPVNFLSDLDITGGNSGSPTLNDKGEFVGIAFDGTLEGVSSDVVFDGTRSRTIQCDARYILWMMDAIDNADHLIREMGLEPKIQ
jgi:hypothetical protein